MHIELPRDLAEYVSKKIERGECKSVGAVINEALALLALRDRLRRERTAELWGEIQEAVREARRGATVPADSVFTECRRLVASYREASR